MKMPVPKTLRFDFSPDDVRCLQSIINTSRKIVEGEHPPTRTVFSVDRRRGVVRLLAHIETQIGMFEALLSEDIADDI